MRALLMAASVCLFSLNLAGCICSIDSCGGVASQPMTTSDCDTGCDQCDDGCASCLGKPRLADRVRAKMATSSAACECGSTTGDCGCQLGSRLQGLGSRLGSRMGGCQTCGDNACDGGCSPAPIIRSGGWLGGRCDGGCGDPGCQGGCLSGRRGMGMGMGMGRSPLSPACAANGCDGGCGGACSSGRGMRGLGHGGFGQGGLFGGLFGHGAGKAHGCGIGGCGIGDRLCSRCQSGLGGRLGGKIAGCGRPGCGLRGNLCSHCRGRAVAGSLPHRQPMQGAAGQVPSYVYPYYTTRAPRDFLMDNPPSIGY